MTTSMTEIFIVNRQSHINSAHGWYANYERLSKDRTNNEFIEIVKKSNMDKSRNRYTKKECVRTDNDSYDFKNNCLYTWDIEIVEIPTEYYEKEWYEIKNRWNGRESQNYSGECSTNFDVFEDEELILFHEKFRLSRLDSSQKKKIILQCDTLFKYSIIDIYEQYLFEKVEDTILMPEMTDIELRTNLDFIKWIENIQSFDTDTNLENKIINIYRLFMVEVGLNTYFVEQMEIPDFENNIFFMEWIECTCRLEIFDFQNNIKFVEWAENNKQFDTISKYQKNLMFLRKFEIAEIDIKLLNSACFSIETSSNHKENVIILEDKYILYKYMNTGKNILQDTSISPEKKVELLTEFMSNIVENPSTMLDSFKERADFFPGYGCQYMESLKNWKLNIAEQSTNKRL